MRHDLIDKRSLELHRLVAEKIRQQPELMILPRGWEDRLVRFSNENTNGPFSGILSQRERLDVFRRREATGA
jgi:hypothetical protein